LNNKRGLTLGSLFDGIGAFPYAAAFYGIRTLWASEILPAAISVTKRHMPQMKHVGDITQLDGGKLPPVDIITFGSPCQGLSMAGRRKGFEDERSGLFAEAIRVIEEMREATNGKYPRYAVWENVPGALSSNGGSDFRAALEAFAKTEIPASECKWTCAGMVRGGSVDLAWCVYNSQYFGTAQRRRRIFLVADFGGRSSAEILFVEKSLRGYFAAGGTPRQGASAYAPCGAFGAVSVLNDQGGERITAETEDHRPTLRSEAHGNLPAVAMRLREGKEGGGKGPLMQEDKSGTLSSGNDQYLFSPEEDAAAVHQNQTGSVNVSDKAYALTAAASASARNAPLIACGFDLQQITSKENRSTLKEVQPTLCASGQPHVVKLCPCTEGNDKVSGTLCASGAGLSHTGGMASEPDFCVVEHSAHPCSFQGYGQYKESDKSKTLLNSDKASSSDVIAYCLQGNSIGRKDTNGPNGSGAKEEKSFTLTASDNHAVAAIDCRNFRETSEKSGTLMAKGEKPGWSLNAQNPIRMGYAVRRLTPTECERLMGFPDGWTKSGDDGEPISDTRRYQMLGNSIATPCAAYVMQGIAEQMKGA
jgi:DNA (cytosine-5)-methyltransferase 1